LRRIGNIHEMKKSRLGGDKIVRPRGQGGHGDRRNYRQVLALAGEIQLPQQNRGERVGEIDRGEAKIARRDVPTLPTT